MSHELIRLTKSLKNKPHLIEASAFDDLLGYLGQRNEGYFEQLAKESKDFSQSTARERVSVENGTAVIPVDGPLSYEFTGIAALCGMTTYQQLESDVEEAIRQGADRIALDVSSPGGEAYHNFETAAYIRDICQENDVSLLAYVDGTSASAAYALTCVADEIIVNPMAKVGSIGVVIKIFNELPKEVAEGTELTFIYAGESKIPYNEDGTFKEQFKEGLQEDVDKLYTQFVDFVSDNISMTPSQVMATQAEMFDAQEATDMGLADRIMTTNDFYEYLADLGDEVEAMPMRFWRKDSTRAEASQEEQPQQAEGSQEELPETQPTQEHIEEDNEMNIEELLSSEDGIQKVLESPKVQEQLSAMAEEKAQPLREQLEQYQAKQEEAAKAQYKELVGGYSFIPEQHQETVATFLYQHKDDEGIGAVMESLENARNAIDEAIVDDERGDEGESLEVDEDEKSKSTIKKLMAERYNKSK